MRNISESTDDLRPENPKKNANILSSITFWFTLKIFKVGWKRELNESDLTKPLDEHKSEVCGHKLALLWSKEVEKTRYSKKKPSFGNVLVKMFAKEIIVYGLIVATMELIFRINQPLFLSNLLKFFDDDNRKAQENNEKRCYPTYFMRLFAFKKNQCSVSLGEAYFFASGVLICSIVAILVRHPYAFGVLHIGMRMRIATCSLIYRKSLRLNVESVSRQTIGKAVNLVTTDVNRFDVVPLFINYIWIGPIQVGIAMYILWNEMEFSGIIGIIAILTFIPMQLIFGLSMAFLRFRTATCTDERVGLMNEIIKAIQVIKMYAWEHAFSRVITLARKREIDILKYTGFIKGTTMSLIMFITRLGTFLTTLYYVIDGNEISAIKVFAVTAYYQVIKQTMTVFVPQGIWHLAEAIVSARRIGQFLSLPESEVGDKTPIDPNGVTNRQNKDENQHQSKENTQTESNSQPTLTISNIWASFDKNVCLREINLQMEPGQLTAIIGPVGSGKSCLIHLIMGELLPFNGTIYYNGTLSYSSQEPWLFPGSVRQNILFGLLYENNKYKKVISVCALEKDFALLPYGDKTIIGERGVSLSGGQKARVNLARCIYRDADIYLLDDPLSAVDTHVGQQIFNNCILNYLLKNNKIVMLVTHQLQYLLTADQIALMLGGCIKALGNYDEVIASGLEFTKVIEEAHDKSILVVDTVIQKLPRELSLTKTDDQMKREFEGPKATAEIRTVGSLGFYVYKEYFKAGGNACVICLLGLFFFGAEFFASGSDYFLSRWVKIEKEHKQSMKSNLDTVTRNRCIAIYSSLIAITIVVSLTRSFFYFIICMKASINLHNNMFHSIIHASMSFFNKTTSGVILNRFSKDMGCVDEMLPTAMIDAIQVGLSLIGSCVIISIVAPNLLIPICIICVIFFYLRKCYLNTSRSVKRLDGITRSAVIAHLNSTLQGLITIRSNVAEMILVSEFDKYQDIHSSAWFMFISTSRAFTYALDVICVFFMAIVLFYYMYYSATSDGAEVGLALTQVIGLTGIIAWGMRQSAELVNLMTSVERILEFMDVEHEEDLESLPENKPSPSWPQNGQIKIINLSLQYDLGEDPVIKLLNLEIQAKEKVGIVGRTGAGKSSIISALFRLAYLKGDIIIDGVYIKNIGLHDLRKKISIIPQDPVIFSGTLRSNLDPFGEYSDQAVFNALVVAEIQLAFMHGMHSLDTPMSEDGSNLSAGERQMVCLARAILRNNVIIIMDEATANMDVQTDKFIQHTIRTKFKHCTVITIAHRLNTIMDYDRVLVMDAGTAVEFDAPHTLLQNESGLFTAMVKKTGQTMASHLRQVAEDAYLGQQKW